MLLLRVLSSILFFGVWAFSISAAETVHLASGFDLQAQSHSVDGTAFTFFTQTGTIELPKTEVLGIDAIPDPPTKNEKSLDIPPQDLVSMIKAVAASQAATPEFIRLVRCVAQIESSLRADAQSPKGATGLMQLMPETAKELGVMTTNARDNVEGGAKYLKELLVRYHNDSVLALAAYNAGPGAVEKFGGVPPYTETRRYIQKVLQEYARLQSMTGAPK